MTKGFQRFRCALLELIISSILIITNAIYLGQSVYELLGTKILFYLLLMITLTTSYFHYTN